MKLILKKLNHSYKISTDTGKTLGSFQLDCDGSYYYYRNEELDGAESSYSLRLIADKLDEVNKPLDDLQKVYFANERKIFELGDSFKKDLINGYSLRGADSFIPIEIGGKERIKRIFNLDEEQYKILEKYYENTNFNT